MAHTATDTDITLDLCPSCTHVLAVGTDPDDVNMGDAMVERILAATANLHVYGPVIDDRTELDNWGPCDTCGAHGGRHVVPADYR